MVTTTAHDDEVPIDHRGAAQIHVPRHGHGVLIDLAVNLQAGHHADDLAHPLSGLEGVVLSQSEDRAERHELRLRLQGLDFLAQFLDRPLRIGLLAPSYGLLLLEALFDRRHRRRGRLPGLRLLGLCLALRLTRCGRLRVTDAGQRQHGHEGRERRGAKMLSAHCDAPPRAVRLTAVQAAAHASDTMTVNPKTMMAIGPSRTCQSARTTVETCVARFTASVIHDTVATAIGDPLPAASCGRFGHSDQTLAANAPTSTTDAACASGGHAIQGRAYHGFRSSSATAAITRGSSVCGARGAGSCLSSRVM